MGGEGDFRRVPSLCLILPVITTCSLQPSSHNGIPCGGHFTLIDGICLAQHRRGPLPCLALMPEAHPGRCRPALGCADLRPCHPPPSSLSALPFIPADTASSCLGLGQMPGGSKSRFSQGQVKLEVERHSLGGKARLGRQERRGPRLGRGAPDENGSQAVAPAALQGHGHLSFWASVSQAVGPRGPAAQDSVLPFPASLEAATDAY